MKKKIFILTFLICFVAQKSFAYSSDPKEFISEIVEEAKKILVETNTKEYSVNITGTDTITLSGGITIEGGASLTS